MAQKIAHLALPTYPQQFFSVEIFQNHQRHPPLFSIIADNYLSWLEYESDYADRERIRYETHIKQPLGNLPIDQITVSVADALKHALLPQMAVGSVKKCLNLCRAIFFHAISTGTHFGRNPFSQHGGLRMPKGATACERFLTPEEANLLLDELGKRSPQLRDMCYGYIPE